MYTGDDGRLYFNFNGFTKLELCVTDCEIYELVATGDNNEEVVLDIPHEFLDMIVDNHDNLKFANFDTEKMEYTK